MTDEDRLTDLEIRLSYQEDTLIALEKLVVKQSEQIALLERANQTLYERLNHLLENMDAGRTGGDDEKPPHY